MIFELKNRILLDPEDGGARHYLFSSSLRASTLNFPYFSLRHILWYLPHFVNCTKLRKLYLTKTRDTHSLKFRWVHITWLIRNKNIYKGFSIFYSMFYPLLIYKGSLLGKLLPRLSSPYYIFMGNVTYAQAFLTWNHNGCKPHSWCEYSIIPRFCTFYL
jgi:hypothetical protein